MIVRQKNAKILLGAGRLAFTGIVSMLLFACAQEPANPADETPVDPSPGFYRISVTEKVGRITSEPELAKEPYCVTLRETATFMHKIVAMKYIAHGSCAPKTYPREGNQIGGEIKCNADAKMAAGTNRFVYTGKLAADKATAEVKIKFDAAVKEDQMTEAQAAQLKLGMKMMERAKTIITAERIGDC